MSLQEIKLMAETHSVPDPHPPHPGEPSRVLPMVSPTEEDLRALVLLLYSLL